MGNVANIFGIKLAFRKIEEHEAIILSRDPAACCIWDSMRYNTVMVTKSRGGYARSFVSKEALG